MAASGLGPAGIAFFGGLCAGTFGLGVWQTQRYFDKVEFMKQREAELALSPLPISEAVSSIGTGMRQRLVKGNFLHSYTILVGPRGAAPGALGQDPRAGQGLNTSPQGYFVITPMKDRDSQETVLVNRGWIPRNMALRGLPYYKPEGEVTVIGVPMKTEDPKFLVPEHDFDKRTFFWFDLKTLEQLNNIEPGKGLLLAQIRDRHAPDIPAQPPLESVGEVRITPMVHQAYAFTWFSLAGAGTYMTRMLMTRGRG